MLKQITIGYIMFTQLNIMPDSIYCRKEFNGIDFTLKFHYTFCQLDVTLHFTLFTQKFAKQKSRHTVQKQHSRRETVRHKMH